MIVIDSCFREWYKKEYGIELPKDKYFGIDYQWSEQELEMAEKYLNGECFNEFTGIDFLEYAKDYNEILLEKQNNNLSKETLLEILVTLRKLYEANILKKINYNLLILVIDYRITFDEKLLNISFDEYIIENLKRNGNHEEWLGV
jgi:hypothetical protein